MSDRHEQFAGKNAALGKAWGNSTPQNSKAPSKEARTPQAPGPCEKCGEVKPLRSYRVQQHDRTEGAASYGIQFKRLCEQCAPAQKVQKDVPQLSDKAIKAMLRGARKSL